MKIELKIFLSFLLFPVLILCLISINIRIQFMSHSFWINTLSDADVYSSISESLDRKLKFNVDFAGANGGDLTDLYNFVSADTIRLFSEKNIKGLIDYANGKTPQMMVYTPFLNDEIPISSDPSSYFKEVVLGDFLSNYNISIIEESDFETISGFNIWSWRILFISYFLLLLIVVYLFLLTGKGERFVLIAIPLFISGIFIILVSLSGLYLVDGLTGKYSNSPNFLTSILSTIIPPLFVKAAFVWICFGILAVISGIILFLVKKPLFGRSSK